MSNSNDASNNGSQQHHQHHHAQYDLFALINNKCVDAEIQTDALPPVEQEANAAASSSSSAQITKETKDAEVQTDESLITALVESYLNQTKLIGGSATTPSPSTKRRSTRAAAAKRQANPNSKYYEGSDDSDGDESFSPAKRRRSGASSNYDDDEELEVGVPTCVAVHRLPFIMEEVTASIKDDMDNYDLYAIETLILNASMATNMFRDESSLVAELKKAVESDKFKLNKKKWKTPLPQPSYDVEEDEQVIEEYNEMMESDKMQRARSYKPLNLPPFDEEKWKKFEEAVQKFPNSVNSNKRIAEFMGDNMHPNHVPHYKNLYKKRVKDAQEQSKKKK